MNIQEYSGLCRIIKAYPGLQRLNFTLYDYAGLYRTKQDDRMIQDITGIYKTEQDYLGLFRTIRNYTEASESLYRTMHGYTGV